MNRDVISATGGCLCGAVRYRTRGAPRATSHCHCRSCRRATGGPSLAWVIFEEDQVTIEHGVLTIFESSPGVERGFCGRCGASLTYRRANRPGLFDVTTASLDDPEAFPPEKEIWTSERLSWVEPNPALPQFAQFSTPARPLADCGQKRKRPAFVGAGRLDNP
ncbi:MAG: GFA family protein [Hyphomonadaceae bacterium]